MIYFLVNASGRAIGLLGVAAAAGGIAALIAQDKPEDQKELHKVREEFEKSQEEKRKQKEKENQLGNNQHTVKLLLFERF